MRTTAAMMALMMVPALLAGTAPAGEPWTLEDMVTKGEDGTLRFHHKPVDERFLNPWPSEWEEEFQDRAAYIVREQAAEGVSGGNTYFENEKRTYGRLMTQVLGGHVEEAMRVLQGEDAQAGSWHKHTKGIDWYACFTIKHQARKYFYFGDLLRDDYRQRMYESAKIWTEKDPKGRPHHAYEGAQGWGPNARNSWVDTRGTENLWLMRNTTVYLMAEETGNEQTAGKYKDKLLRYAKLLYRVGMGEWDSENYHGHSIAPLHNLYDFAKDPEVKLAAKAALDFLYTAGAVKYYRGGFNGPTKRDYNHVQPFGGSAAALLWTVFGDTVERNEHFETDEVHLITSAYRPPPAVMNLARKAFDRPREIFACKGGYGWATSGRTGEPQFYETQYFGRTFQLGTLAGGTRPGRNDVNGFKIMAFSSRRNVLDIQAAPTADPHYVGSAKYNDGKIVAANRVAQNGPVAIWLAEDGAAPWRWVLPEIVEVETRDGVTFLKGERTWFAIRPIHTTPVAADAEATKALHGSRKNQWPEHQVLSAKGQGGAYCGLAIEIGEAPAYEGYEQFRQAVLAKSELDVTGLADGRVGFTAADGRSVGMIYADKLEDFTVTRDGEQHDWSEHGEYLYAEPGKGDDGLIHAEWMGGTLTVNADGRTFTCTVSDDGEVTFENR